MQALFVAGHKSDKVWSELVVLPMQAGMKVDFSREPMVWLVFISLRAKTKAQEIGQALVKQLAEVFTAEAEPMTSGQLTEWWQGALLSVGEQAEVVVGQLTKEGQVTLVVKGSMGVMIRREGQVGWLVKPGAAEWQERNGKYREGDKWFIGTAELFQALGAATISAELDGRSGEDIQAAIATKIQQQALAGVAGAVVDFGQVSGLVKETARTEETVVVATAEPQVYLKDKPLKRRRLVAVGLGLVSLMLVGAWLGGKRQVAVNKQAEVEAVIAQATRLMEEAKTSEATVATQKLIQASEELKQAEAKWVEDETIRAKVAERRQAVDQLYVLISGEQSFQEVPVWYDLSLLKTGFFGTRMDQNELKMMILDGMGGIVASLGFDKKEAGLTGSGQLLQNGSLMAVSGQRTIVLAPGGVYEVNIEEKTTGELMKADPTWQRIGALGLFAGNVYLVDAGASDIYIYPGLAAGVGGRQRWLKPGQEPDLTNVIDMTIDGDIWTLDQAGKIRRFRQGTQIDYLISGLVTPIKEAVGLTVRPESEQVYVLDRGGSRVVVFDKKGVYVNQYIWQGLAGATDLAVDEAGGGLLILSGKEIYRLEMGQ